MPCRDEGTYQAEDDRRRRLDTRTAQLCRAMEVLEMV
jgi:hypothetical protein